MAKLKSRPLLIGGLALFLAVSCGTEFTGGGSGGLGKRFSGGSNSSDKDTPDAGNGNGPNSGDGGIGVDGAGNLPGGSIGNGQGVDTTNYRPMNVKVHRRDISVSDEYDHENITLAYQVVGGPQIESGVIGNQSDTFTIQRACPTSGSVNAVIQFQLETGAKVSPTTNQNVGGPIGYRLSQQAILVGFEKEGVNNASEKAYHNNDDLVVELSCSTGAHLTVKNLCLDQRIPNNGWDLVDDAHTYAGDAPPDGATGPARLCNGS